jgi:hypothetical protein
MVKAGVDPCREVRVRVWTRLRRCQPRMNIRIANMMKITHQISSSPFFSTQAYARMHSARRRRITHGLCLDLMWVVAGSSPRLHLRHCVDACHGRDHDTNPRPSPSPTLQKRTRQISGLCEKCSKLPHKSRWCTIQNNDVTRNVRTGVKVNSIEGPGW